MDSQVLIVQMRAIVSRSPLIILIVFAANTVCMIARRVAPRVSPAFGQLAVRPASLALE